MATGQLNRVIQHIRRAMYLRDGAGQTDGQLLEAYVRRRDEAALASVVRRHGSMVWGVCRRVLSNYHDAEDAFQATFLVLVRRAASIAAPELLANWLYGVAHMTALKARASALKRKARERQATEMPEPEDRGQHSGVRSQEWDDLQPLLDQELSRLPNIYRVVLVLCDLEGKTRKEAARRLGLPEGTIGSRLARARVALAKRLCARGVTLSGGALAALLAQNAASASVPDAVVSCALRAASFFGAGQAATAGLVPARVVTLAEGVVKAMMMSKLKAVVAGVLVLGLIVLGAASGTTTLGSILTTRSAGKLELEVQAEDAEPKAPGGHDAPVPISDPQEAINALEKMQVRLERDKNGFVVHARFPVQGCWLDEAVPHLERLPKLDWVACHADNMTAEGLRKLGALRPLTQFELHADKDLPPLPWQLLRTVRTLRLSGNGIDNEVLKAVGAMPGVTDLHLNRVAATAAGLAHIKKLRSLEMLLIQGSNVTAEGVRNLDGIEQLQSLTLAGNRIGAPGFAHLATMKRLQYLNLESTGCTDANVASLAALTDLRDLDLGYNVGVTDAGLKHVAALQKLAGLRLYETKVSERGVADLKKALPGLVIGK